MIDFLFFFLFFYKEKIAEGKITRRVRDISMVMIDMVDVIEDEDRCVLRVILVFSHIIEPRVEYDSYESRSRYWLFIDPCSLLAFVQFVFDTGYC